MKLISKISMVFFLIIATIIQVFLVVSASDSFEVKCTINDIRKSEISIEIYDVTELNEAVINKDANQIFKYLQENNIKPNVKSYFNESGIFTVNGLENRLLLIKAGNFYKNNILYKAIPQLIDSSKIDILEIVETKYEFEIPDDSSVTYTVKKEWYQEDNKNHDKISISIFHGGVIYDTVYLSSQNDWTYQWSGANDKDWYVKEDNIPEGYTVSYSQESNLFKITNIKDEKYYEYIEENGIPNSNITQETPTSTFTNIKDSIYKYIKENLIPKSYTPQTGLKSVLENMGGRIVVIILCIIISSCSLIIRKKIKRKGDKNI